MITLPSRHLLAGLLLLWLPARAELLEAPLLLKERGPFLEVKPAVFLRSSSIERISGVIRLSGKRLKVGGPGPVGFNELFPLSEEGLQQLKEFDQYPKAEWRITAEVSLSVDEISQSVVRTHDQDPWEKWEEFEKAVGKSIQALNRALEIASKG